LSKLSEGILAGRFMVTSELNPPKGTNLEPMFERARSLKDYVDAFNITDSHAAKMSISPLATAHLLMDQDIEPIMQMTARDRNRIALQGDLLGAGALGIPNIVFMGGDPPKIGDHPEATGVFDLMSNDVLDAARRLAAGKDLHDNELNGAPEYFLGAVVNPGASDLDTEISKMNAKIEAGAQFLQSQAIYDASSFERFMNRVDGLNVSILAGIILLKSAKMARYMTENVPGIDVPDALIQEMEDAENKGATSVEIAARIINQIKPLCQGIHIMPLGWEDKIPALLEAVEAG
jgi:methylenetetrahydrofolate reductase (NADPH)